MAILPSDNSLRRIVLVGLPLSVAVLALGAVTQGTLLLVLASLVPAVLVARAPARADSPARATASLYFWGLVAIALAQLVPVPIAFLNLVSPEGAKLWLGAYAEIGEDLRFAPLTLDPPATAFAAASAIAVATFFETAARLTYRRAGRTRVAQMVVAAVGSLAVASVIHPMFALDGLYGFFPPPTGVHPPLLMPLVNPNHDAAITALGLPLLVGLALEDDSSSRRAMYLTGAVASGVLTILTFSRSGILILVLESVVMTVYAVSRRRERDGELRNIAFVMAGAAAAGVITFLANADRMTGEVGDRDVSKLSLVWRALGMTRQFAVAGVGRGAFASVFAGFEGEPFAIQNEAAGRLRFTHAECWPVQLAVDVGFPLALAALATLGFVLYRTGRGAARQGPLGFAALTALGGLVIHDMADFSTEFAGVGMLAAALLAIICGFDARLTPHARPRNPTRWWWRLGSVVIALACLEIPWGHTLNDDEERLAVAFRDHQARPAAGEIWESVRRHPAEPYFAMLDGIRDLDSASAGARLLRAVKLGPWRAQTHFWMARWFARSGHRAQAWAEYKETLRLGLSFVGPVMKDVVAMGAPLDDIEAIAMNGGALDVAADALIASGRKADAVAIDQLQIASYPPAVSAHLRLFEDARLQGRPDEARAIAESLRQRAPESAAGYLCLATLQPPEQADSTLTAGLLAVGDDVQLLAALVRVRGERRGLESIAPELDRFRTAATAKGVLELYHRTLAEVELALDHPAAALPHYLDAASATADAPAYLRRAAESAEAAGRLPLALGLLRRLTQLTPGDLAATAELERVAKIIAENSQKDGADAPP